MEGKGISLLLRCDPFNPFSGEGSGLTIVTFDNFAVCDNPEDCVPEVFGSGTSVEVNSKLSVIWGS